MGQTTPAETGIERQPRPAIQLYTLRSMEESLPQTIRRVSQAGFDGVEFADALFESDPRAVRQALDETGTTAVAIHVDLADLEERLEVVVDRCFRLGCRHVIIPHLGASRFRTTDHVDALARRLENLGDRLRSHGIALSYHTSREPFLPRLDRFGLGTLADLPSPAIGWRLVAEAIDFAVRGSARTVDGTGFDRLVSRTENLTFEVDVGWVAAAGYDPESLLETLHGRLSFIHVTDLARSRWFPPEFRSVPPGTGIVDLDSTLEACRRRDVDWLIFEDDDPSDPVQAIEQGMSVLNVDREGK